MRVFPFAHTAINMLSHIIARRSHVFRIADSRQQRDCRGEARLAR